MQRYLYKSANFTRQQLKPLDGARFLKSTIILNLQSNKAVYDVTIQSIKRHGSKRLRNW